MTYPIAKFTSRWLWILSKLQGRPNVLSSINLTRLVWILLIHDYFGRDEGPAICEDNGYLMSHGAMNEMLWEVMEELWIKNPDSFPKAIKCIEDIRKMIRLFRTMRRASDSQALRMGISQPDINLINRWSDDLRSGKSSSHLYASYAQQDLLNDVYKRYTIVQ